MITHFTSRSPWATTLFLTYQTSAAGRFDDPGMCFYTNGADMRGRGEGRIVATAHNECAELANYPLEFIIRHQWQDPEEGYAPKYRRVVAEEMRTISIQSGSVANVIDVRSQLRPTQWDLRLGPSRHGYFSPFGWQTACVSWTTWDGR